MLQLLEMDNAPASCYVGALNWNDASLREVALQLLLKGLSGKESTRLLARVLASGDESLQSQAAMAVARCFYTDRTALSLQQVPSSEASIMGDLLKHLERRSQLPARPRPAEEGRRVTFVNDPLAMAKGTLGGYHATARMLKPGWMYRQVIPCDSITESIQKSLALETLVELPQVAAERGVSLEKLISCLEFSFVNEFGNYFFGAVDEQAFLAAAR